MNNKQVARHALSFLGGQPKAFRYYNDDESMHMDIMTTVNGHCPGTKVCATIGLNETDLDLISDGRELRVELIMAGLPEEEALENLLCGCAFQVMRRQECFYGDVLTNIMEPYYPGEAMKHAVLLSPVFWDSYSSLSDEEETVSWLYAVPISDAELDYLEKNGTDAFQSLLEDKKADVLDIHRASCI